MMRLFDAPWGALTGWVHYLCFDAFVARWMVNQAPDAGYKLSWSIATMMFGPIGLLVFFAARRWQLATLIAQRGVTRVLSEVANWRREGSERTGRLGELRDCDRYRKLRRR